MNNLSTAAKEIQSTRTIFDPNNPIHAELIQGELVKQMPRGTTMANYRGQPVDLLVLTTKGLQLIGVK
ncbi:MAG: hypothetical protein ACOH2S_27570 [Janthinobacterium svalbardensis]|uniref:hypothetical protein n=1 Tax=Janthinobacterium svalbardensis TaxID=368607 RepID=UPI0012FDE856|nr:hypothetical protein [Janthinobacterium svalbardensis]